MSPGSPERTPHDPISAAAPVARAAAALAALATVTLLGCGAAPCTTDCPEVSGRWTFRSTASGSCVGWEVSPYSLTANVRQEGAQITVPAGASSAYSPLTGELSADGSVLLHSDGHAADGGEELDFSLDVSGTFSGESFSGTSTYTWVVPGQRTPCTIAGSWEGTRGG